MMRIGHRGAKGLEPENTLLAIRTSFENGMDAVEVDVRRTKDNQLVIMHDETVDRTTDGKGHVADMTLAELKRLDAGGGERIPALQEVIGEVKGKGMLMVELKELTTEVAVAEMLEKNGMQDSCYVISFYHSAVRMIKAYSQKLKTGVLFVGEPLNMVEMVKAANAEAAFANHEFVTERMVSKLHNAGMKVVVWNCDDKGSIRRMQAMDVDGICTNRPDVLENVLEKREGSNGSE